MSKNKLTVIKVTVERKDPRDPCFRRLNRRWFWSTLPIIGRFFGPGYVAIRD